MEHKELTEQIIGAAYTVHNEMGAGFLESVYEQCMMIELRHLGLAVENQVDIEVHYQDQLVGQFKADLLVENTVIAELKSVKQIADIHEVQLVNYLVATGLPVGLLINFGPKTVEIKRKVRTLHPES